MRAWPSQRPPGFTALSPHAGPHGAYVEAARTQLFASSPRPESACSQQQQQRRASCAAGSCVLEETPPPTRAPPAGRRCLYPSESYVEYLPTLSSASATCKFLRALHFELITDTLLYSCHGDSHPASERQRAGEAKKMTTRTGFLKCSLQKGTRYAATITLFSTSLLFVTYMVSLYRQHGFLESINRSLGFDVAPASPVVEFMAMLGFGLILLFEMMSSWLAIKATTLESRWLLLPFIGLTTCGIVSPALMSAVIMLSSPTIPYCAPAPHYPNTRLFRRADKDVLPVAERVLLPGAPGTRDAPGGDPAVSGVPGAAGAYR
ncbi:hypothetical protein MTO96_049574 [Rhipicephalus appendiculatus]